MNLTQLKKLIRQMRPAQRKKLYERLGELILEDREAETQGASEPQTGGGKAEQSADGRTYRFESVRCGKKGCKCAEGKLHGPYWYAYWLENGKTKSQYVGKNLPPKR